MQGNGEVENPAKKAKTDSPLDTDHQTTKLSPEGANIPVTKLQPIPGPSKRPSSDIDNQPAAKKSATTGTSSTSIADIGEPMQIESPQGNLTNQKGSVQGESGSRKLQQPQLDRFGIVAVSSLIKEIIQYGMGKLYVFLFREKDQANNTLDLLDFLWQNIKSHCYEKEYAIDGDKELLYIVIFQLDFNIGWSTLKSKMPKIFNDVSYWITNSYDISNKNDDIIEEYIDKFLTCMLKNEVKSLNIDDLIEQENKRKDYNSKHSLNSNDSISNKRKRF